MIINTNIIRLLLAPYLFGRYGFKSNEYEFVMAMNKHRNLENGQIGINALSHLEQILPLHKLLLQLFNNYLYITFKIGVDMYKALLSIQKILILSKDLTLKRSFLNRTRSLLWPENA